jgi:lipopolysaccharide transport system ATP-binding protein
MSEPSIFVENLSKLYHIGRAQQRHDTLRDALVAGLKAPFERFRNSKSEIRNSEDTIWALKDVSFKVQPGEVLGIIGRNGAGKSTLLTILSRITEPTSGRAVINGRVGSLLEVGTGFHPELTGRENIYLNGAILGMTRKEIDQKFDEIVAFAEIEKFLDTPVKRYSSGMYVRLAFAVAAHLEPEILLVDEVLAVGDAGFQKKCLGKMGEVAKEGRTVVFVSHNMGTITRLCKRSLWLGEGKIVLDGLSNKVVSLYQSQYLTACVEWKRPDPETVDSDFAFLSVAVRNHEGQVTSIFRGDEPVSVEIRYLVRYSLPGCQIGTRIYNSDGLVVFTTTDDDSSGASTLPKKPGLYKAIFTIPGIFLASGKYYLLVAAHFPNRRIYEQIEQTVVFEVSPSASLSGLDGRLGVVAPLLSWSTTKEKML